MGRDAWFFLQQKCWARLLLQTSPALTSSSVRRLFLADAGDNFALSRHVIRVFNLRIKCVDDTRDRNGGSGHGRNRSIWVHSVGSRKWVDAFDVVIVIRVDTLKIDFAVEGHIVELGVVSRVARADCRNGARQSRIVK